MDIQYFLEERIRYIKWFYETAVEPFNKTKMAIERGEEPYRPPLGEETDEPPFYAEWEEADTGALVIRQTCISALSDSLILFFEYWRRRWKDDGRQIIDIKIKRRGGPAKVVEIFEKLEWEVSRCPARSDIIEQVILARNQIQHSKSLAMFFRATHSEKDLRRFPKPFFSDPAELGIENTDSRLRKFMPVPVYSSEEKLFEAISEVEKFCSWLEEEYQKFISKTESD